MKHKPHSEQLDIPRHIPVKELSTLLKVSTFTRDVIGSFYSITNCDREHL